MNDDIQARLDAAAALAKKQVRSDPRAAVRKGELNRVLASYNDAVGWQLGHAVTAALSAYDEALVEPLRNQVAWLSLPWYVRVWKRVQAWWAGFRPPAQSNDDA